MSTAPKYLHLVEDEDPAPYDAPKRHITMIDDDVVEEVLRRCGLAAMGLYAYLERKANVNGQCWPPMHELAEVTGASERYVRQLINEKLVPEGFVKRKEQRNKFNRTIGIIYTLPFHQKPRKVGEELPPELREEPESKTSSAKVAKEYLKSNGETRVRDLKAHTPQSPLPDTTPSEQIVKAFCAAVGIDDPVDHQGMMKQARPFVGKLNPDEIAGIVDWMRSDPFWKTKSLNITLVGRRADEWRTTQPQNQHRKMTQEELKALPSPRKWKFGVYPEGHEGMKRWQQDRDNGTLPQLDGSR